VQQNILSAATAIDETHKFV